MSDLMDTGCTVTPRQWERTQFVIRAIWDAFNRGDFGAALEWLHPELELSDHPEMSGTQWHYGHEGAGRWAAKLLEVFVDLNVEVREFVAVDESRLVVTTVVTGRGKRSGAPIGVDLAAVVTMRDGKVQRMDIRTTRSEALAAAAQETGE